MEVKDLWFESSESRSHTNVIDQVERFPTESWMQSEYVMEEGRDLSSRGWGEEGGE